MTLRRLLLAVTCAAISAPLHAEGFLSPFVGGAFGGNTDDTKLTYGGTLTFKGSDGVVGFAIDFGYTPDFVGTTGLGNNNLTSLMGNLVLMAPGSARLYASGGLGLIKTSVDDVTGLFRVDSNELGLNVGGGLMVFPSRSVGLQADVRYFRNLTDPEPDNEFDVDLGSLDFWRATAGIVLKF